jgi:hypothetical protein
MHGAASRLSAAARASTIHAARWALRADLTSGAGDGLASSGSANRPGSFVDSHPQLAAGKARYLIDRSNAPSFECAVDCAAIGSIVPLTLG